MSYGGSATYLTRCAACGGRTSKAYARKNGGKCKACVAGTAEPINGVGTLRGGSFRGRGGYCEDAPCCGCCGPNSDSVSDYYGDR